MMLLVCSVHTEAYANPLCAEDLESDVCMLEITDHTGVEQWGGLGETYTVQEC